MFHQNLLTALISNRHLVDGDRRVERKDVNERLRLAGDVHAVQPSLAIKLLCTSP
jgi:hypothetical protein